MDHASLIEGTRQRLRVRRARRTRRDRWTAWLAGGPFLVVVALWLAISRPDPVWSTLLACAAAHAIASMIEFEIGPGFALPTTPVLMVELFLLPPSLVPVAAVLGLATNAAVGFARDRTRRERLLVLSANGWHAVGPALVVGLIDDPSPGAPHGATLVAALAAQLLFDAASSWLRNCVGLGVPTKALFGALRFTFAVDVLLAPIGVAAALASPHSPVALLWLITPIALLRLLQRDRKQRIDHTVALSRAVSDTAATARRDPLTGLGNRLAWEEELLTAATRREPIGVVLVDVDGLKAANDVHGHDAGDELIVTVAAQLQQRLGAGAVLVARLGGDEFGALILGADLAQLEALAAQLRLAQRHAPPVRGAIAVSASIGVAVAADGADLPDAMRRADKGVYDDKRARAVQRG